MDSFSRHTDYGHQSLDEAQLEPDPLVQFATWLKAAEDEGVYEPNAFVLGTVASDGSPNARTVLLKGLIDGEFFFASNYSSRKAQEIDLLSKVSMVFGWYSMHRQVIIQGSVRKASRQQSSAYFQSRPHDSKVAALVSDQSQPIESRQKLQERFALALTEYQDKPVPTPSDWGGYLITPLRIEFWQGRTSRMHDRVEFRRPNPESDWYSQRLQP